MVHVVRIITEDVGVRLDGRDVLRDINISMDGPGLYFLLGRNGSGKSTLLRTLAGLLRYEGSIWINGRELRRFRRKELARIVGFVWQNPLFGFFEYNVEREIKFILKNLDMDEANFREIVEFFGVDHLLDRRPFSLSGGEAKRVEICSVLVANQPILLMDEPEGELDLDGLRRLLVFLEHGCRRKLILVATHNTMFAYRMRRIAKGYFIISEGRIQGFFGPSILEDEDFLSDVGIIPVDW